MSKHLRVREKVMIWAIITLITQWILLLFFFDNGDEELAEARQRVLYKINGWHGRLVQGIISINSFFFNLFFFVLLDGENKMQRHLLYFSFFEIYHISVGTQPYIWMKLYLCLLQVYYALWSNYFTKDGTPICIFVLILYSPPQAKIIGQDHDFNRLMIWSALYSIGGVGLVPILFF